MGGRTCGAGGDNARTGGIEMSFDSVWARIGQAAGQEFRTVTGKAFSFTIVGNAVKPDHTNRLLPRSDFEKAYSLAPLRGPGQINLLVQGPAYVYAILTDPRIAG